MNYALDYKRTVEVDTPAEAFALAARAEALFDDLTSFWPRFEREYLRTTLPVRWDRGFGLGLDLSDQTVDERASRLEGTYYSDHPPLPKANAGGPVYVWTGALQEAVQFFTLTSPSRARIDPDANYTGPIPEGFSFVLAPRVSDEALWSSYLPEFVRDSLEPWARERLAAL